jgi:hypothetical protein
MRLASVVVVVFFYWINTQATPLLGKISSQVAAAAMSPAAHALL